ncbi:EMYY motif lipoprotein [Staphylococcus succinus]|uniref:EMYY motif lipoprotein n=1 Tax=Staphylococcus succinus TaxID=61015 RepID=UPI00062B58B3|nr:EMYY motif lipoprotein [Staphylococcus succinus]MDH9162123.1 EMYY motif lipoprotein [Staphylococcus succinus]PNZ18621.1 EMYY motif lipoprotein [Staphylococcus succinus subsp. succinus]
MKKILCIILVICFSVALSACGNKASSEFKDFDTSLNDVKNKGNEVEKVTDDIHLKRLDDLSKTDMTDENKKEFNNLQNRLNSQLVPKMDEYEKAAKQLPAESKETKELKSSYLDVVEQKKSAINELTSFVDLYNQSIKANEDILDYTKLFEKNRSQVEKNMQKANNAGETADVNNFKHKLEQNNKDLRQTAESALESSDSNKVKHAINEEIMPLITAEIKDLNKAEIKDGYVNDARKNAIEMYYSLQNYYETREETIENSEKLKRIDYDKLPQEGKDIEQFDKTFDKRYSELKHSYN